MNVLVIGGGGREHALCWALDRSASVQEVYVAPGNAGTLDQARPLDLDVQNSEAVAAACARHGIDLVVVGPEAPLVAGLADDLRAKGIAVCGPGRAAAQLEGSKTFTKELCARAGIPTARFESFDDRAAARAYVQAQGAPIVVKADGLAGGKGVVVAQSVDAALAAVDGCFDKPGARVVIEECLTGPEASYFALCDGETVLELGTAQDHKRVGEGDTGPNTGGMGAFSPAVVLTPALKQRVHDEIVAPTVRALKDAGTPFVGILYAGLMLTEDGPKLIEYNVRLGDPEAQALLVRLESDLGELLMAAARGRLAGHTVALAPHSALCVVMAAEGYPGAVETGTPIAGITAAEAEGATVFHAATLRTADGALHAMGGRVLGVTALGADLAEARRLAYQSVDRIDWPAGFCRRDIGAAAAGEGGAT
ncbi:phosphoribosylamine--glycine ligase [Rhodothalassium salexigens DSM 2132]|uniref:Phosphoribosylamine--glycine ligase n=1 Tax=Rhodothalassium salexigens DSM 2132 TaxID=1188247 RepID=A0A4V2SQ59_RHOSA|nr:phosphoribosylamine--glycine ligase [Rhodothalassium salexigens]MBB4210708.1 phosphoribosylamine--glycine ligase [Rhodothalassium salexigens DSM 2132]MBK1637909.1 phosphoribosylamine--glycine ligase [Rhodothalassium salexigens DSM 2132]TCP37736.1 phosphoribosylamine--glycine ligase [Rhodothalassium salexigens DSM 2132]